MQRFWKVFYSFIIIPALWILLQALGLMNAKVRRGIRGRTNLFASLARDVAALPPGKRVWFHSSSMGEFEQAKPVIAALKQRRPDVRILVSFFSPSGYEHSKKYPLADVICYIPFDTRRNARLFLDLIRPDVAVMVRYDIWPNHIWELHRRGIPTLLANATMRERTRRQLPLVRALHHYIYDAIDEILTVSENDARAFGRFRLKHPRIGPIGDTRFDQVCIRKEEALRRHLIPSSIVAGRKVVVVGSSWPEDEAVVIPAYLELRKSVGNMLLIIVPHEPTIEHLEELEQQLLGNIESIRFSALNEYRGEPVILVDSVGILLVLYASAHIAYVGGSFRQGVHNVLEAAVFGIPVLFGPRHRNSQEPLMLVERGGAFVVNDSAELHRTLQNLLVDGAARATAGEHAAAFVLSNVGATERFLQHLGSYLARSAEKALPT